MFIELLVLVNRRCLSTLIWNNIFCFIRHSFGYDYGVQSSVHVSSFASSYKLFYFEATRPISAFIAQLSVSVWSQGYAFASCNIRCTCSRNHFHQGVVNVEVHVLAAVHEHDVVPDTSGDLQWHVA